MDFIEKSTSAEDLKVLLEILKERPHLKARIFGHVPDINPLNPKRDNPVSSDFGKRMHPLERTGDRWTPTLFSNLGIDRGTIELFKKKYKSGFPLSHQPPFPSLILPSPTLFLAWTVLKIKICQRQSF